MPNPKRIVSKTKGATIKKQGHTTSGKYGESLTKSKKNKVRDVGPQG